MDLLICCPTNSVQALLQCNSNRSINNYSAFIRRHYDMKIKQKKLITYKKNC